VSAILVQRIYVGYLQMHLFDKLIGNCMMGIIPTYWHQSINHCLRSLPLFACADASGLFFTIKHVLYLDLVFLLQIPSSRTLITPVQCKSLWRQFKSETEHAVTQAISAQVQYRYIYHYVCKCIFIFLHSGQITIVNI
jgi:hypothetical protein